VWASLRGTSGRSAVGIAAIPTTADAAAPTISPSPSPACEAAPDVDVHEGAVRRGAVVVAETALPARAGGAIHRIDQPEQPERVAAADDAVAVEIVHAIVVLAIDEDVGGGA